ncbi:MAG: ATP-binding cassette domain-containing protein [Acidianus sp.]|uniref:ATP-binding cassette domain-containing protein n=1 Tax=Acidianus sp. TaxID=1872104 RepID=UPI00397A6C1B
MLVLTIITSKGSVEVDKQEIVGLLGRNGSGKTTMLKSVLCDSQNQVILDGKDFCKEKDYSKVSLVLQEPYSQILAETAKEEVELLSRYHRVNEEIVKNIMGEYYDKKFLELSDGYKRRFVISTTLASMPEYVLLDEPFANLDKYSTAEVKEIIPKGTLIAEHRVKEIRDMLDRVYLLEDKIEEIDKEKLYDENFLKSHGLRGFKLSKIESKLGKEILDVHTTKARIEVRESEVLCLIGRNGVGKTTTLKQLVGKVYVIFQNPDLQFFCTTVREEVKGREDVLSLFNLKDKEEKSPYTLSYGEKMRVLIASAYASGRKVIALDEPSVGMDGNSLLSFYEMIKLLKEEKRGIIIATHDEDIIGMCDSIIDLDKSF